MSRDDLGITCRCCNEGKYGELRSQRQRGGEWRIYSPGK